MIVVDTSVWAAMIFNELDASRYQDLIENTETLLVSAATVVELNMIVTRKLGDAAAVDVVDLMEFAGTEIVPVDSDQAGHAVSAYIRFGEGRHPAGLNYGDLFAYALAKSRDLPLLFKGGGFAETDITPALVD